MIRSILCSLAIHTRKARYPWRLLDGPLYRKHKHRADIARDWSCLDCPEYGTDYERVWFTDLGKYGINNEQDSYGRDRNS